MSPQMAASFISSSTTWWIWTSWQWRPRSPPPQTSTQPSAQGVCVCVDLSVRLSLLKGKSNDVFFCSDLLKSDTLLSCLYTSDQGRETPNPANRYQFDKVGWGCQIIKVKIRRLKKTIEFNKIAAELTHNLLLGLFALLIMWRSWAIPTCGFRVSEDCIFPKILQRCVLKSIIPVLSHLSTVFHVLQPHHVDICSCFPGCARGQFSECQPNGEHHEAAEGTSPVPSGFAQTVCLFRYVIC